MTQSGFELIGYTDHRNNKIMKTRLFLLHHN